MWTKSLAAILLGLPAAIAWTALAALLWPGSLHRNTLPILLLVFPVWIGFMSFALCCRNGKRAWGWLSVLTCLGFALIHVVKTLHWVVLPT